MRFVRWVELWVPAVCFFEDPQVLAEGDIDTLVLVRLVKFRVGFSVIGRIQVWR